jgi:hypothetical protein
MSISKVVFTILSGNAGVNALVGTRVEPLFQPKGAAFPFIVWEKISLQTNPSDDCQSGYDIYRIEVKSVAKTKTGADALADAVRSAMAIIKPTTVATTFTVHKIIFDNENDLFAENGGYEGAFTISQDYLIHIKP